MGREEGGEKQRGTSRHREQYHEVVTQRRNGVIGYEPAAREPTRGSVDLEGVNWSRGIVLLREGDARKGQGGWKRQGKGTTVSGHELDGHCVAFSLSFCLCARASSSPPVLAFCSSYTVRVRERRGAGTPLCYTTAAYHGQTVPNRAAPYPCLLCGILLADDQRFSSFEPCSRLLWFAFKRPTKPFFSVYILDRYCPALNVVLSYG